MDRNSVRRAGTAIGLLTLGASCVSCKKEQLGKAKAVQAVKDGLASRVYLAWQRLDADGKLVPPRKGEALDSEIARAGADVDKAPAGRRSGEYLVSTIQCINEPVFEREGGDEDDAVLREYFLGRTSLDDFDLFMDTGYVDADMFDGIPEPARSAKPKDPSRKDSGVRLDPDRVGAHVAQVIRDTKEDTDDARKLTELEKKVISAVKRRNRQSDGTFLRPACGVVMGVNAIWLDDLPSVRTNAANAKNDAVDKQMRRIGASLAVAGGTTLALHVLGGFVGAALFYDKVLLPGGVGWTFTWGGLAAPAGLTAVSHSVGLLQGLGIFGFVKSHVKIWRTRKEAKDFSVFVSALEDARKSALARLDASPLKFKDSAAGSETTIGSKDFESLQSEADTLVNQIEAASAEIHNLVLQGKLPEADQLLKAQTQNKARSQAVARQIEKIETMLVPLTVKSFNDGIYEKHLESSDNFLNATVAYRMQLCEQAKKSNEGQEKALQNKALQLNGQAKAADRSYLRALGDQFLVLAREKGILSRLRCPRPL